MRITFSKINQNKHTKVQKYTKYIVSKADETSISKKQKKKQRLNRYLKRKEEHERLKKRRAHRKGPRREEKIASRRLKAAKRRCRLRGGTWITKKGVCKARTTEKRRVTNAKHLNFQNL